MRDRNGNLRRLTSEVLVRVLFIQGRGELTSRDPQRQGNSWWPSPINRPCPSDIINSFSLPRTLHRVLWEWPVLFLVDFTFPTATRVLATDPLRSGASQIWVTNPLCETSMSCSSDRRCRERLKAQPRSLSRRIAYLCSDTATTVRNRRSVTRFHCLERSSGRRGPGDVTAASDRPVSYSARLSNRSSEGPTRLYVTGISSEPTNVPVSSADYSFSLPNNLVN